MPTPLPFDPMLLDDLAAPLAAAVDDRSLRLPAHCTTVTAEDIGVRLVLGIDLDDSIEVDASEVESIGQAALQLLVAARAQAVASGKKFTIVDPSRAFIDRVTGCRLAQAVGLESQEGAYS